MAKKKKKTAAKAVEGVSKRLTPEQRTAIMTDTSGRKLAEMASAFNTSIATIAAYRKKAGGKTSTAPTERKAGRGSGTKIEMEVRGDHIVLTVPRSQKLILVKILGELLD